MEGVTEFFTSGDEVWYITDKGFMPLKESSPIIAPMIEKIRELYPKAYAALARCYANSALNIPYFNFLVVRRFCKCNFGTLDHTKKDIASNAFNFEHVSCPLRGECPYETVICSPQINTQLSDAEKRVMRLVCEGRSNAEIAHLLYLSPNTIKRHIASSYIKVGARNRADFVQYANKNNLFINQ